MSGEESPRCECRAVRRAHAEGLAEGCQGGLILLPARLLGGALPPLRAQAGAGDEAIAYLKWFTPGSGYSWFLTEFDPVERHCFGWVEVVGGHSEWAYWDLAELEELRYGPLGIWRVERDIWWQPATVSQVKAGRN